MAVAELSLWKLLRTLVRIMPERSEHGDRDLKNLSTKSLFLVRLAWVYAYMQLRRTFSSLFPIAALKEEYPDVMVGPNGAEEIQVFKRRWIYY